MSDAGDVVGGSVEVAGVAVGDVVSASVGYDFIAA